MALKKIPVTVITGFLGAGKTSLIRHLISNAQGKKMALLINEFGDLGVDGEILAGCGDETCTEDDIVELTNGCICCTVADDFLPTLEQLLDRDEKPDHIVIETSGLALPKPLVKAFQWPEVKSRTTVDSVVAVVDGPAVHNGMFADDPDAVQAQREADEMLDHDSPLAEVFEDQLSCADIVVVSKADLMDDTTLDAVQKTISSELRNGVQILPAENGALDPTLLLGLDAMVEDDLDSRPSHHDGAGEEHDHDDFESFVVGIPPVTDPATITESASRALAVEGVLRIKGFAAIDGKEARLALQGVGSRLEHYFDRPWRSDETRQGKLVVIGLTGFDRHNVEQIFAD
ncbi:MAG: cobalamin biosynthesis protein CobW [Rhodospirillaceae bacterium]|nr:cobalamin biosynthesis protein CobW [Rhodospirillaceae bacterium]|tara:strand:+ start:36950 stop:37984 length:1035 start_codon:yes stop_codon:yes gene_type:complete